MSFDRITSDPAVLTGMPCIRGLLLRVSVATVVGIVADGMASEEILADSPYLEPEDVTESQHYASEAGRRRLPFRYDLVPDHR